MTLAAAQWIDKQASISHARLRPRLVQRLAAVEAGDMFLRRFDEYFADAFRALYKLYGAQYDFFYHIESLLLTAADAFAERSAVLLELDTDREANPNWFQSEQMMGAVCYVDLFAGTLQGVCERIPYFKQLGLTYLHLMPLFDCPQPNNDGGYAVSSFRKVNPALGTMDDLRQLTADLRAEGISLVLDFVFNHTSDEHEWAQRALAGDEAYQNFYWMFDDRSVPDLYKPFLREIFPEQAPGSFTYREDVQKWVWTTFNPFQWDLNYRNPALLNAMLCEMLFLANQGVEILRLDAVPFVWKALGTSCENLPEVHLIIQAFNAFVRMAAPALLFKSEAIVHPRDVRSYISADECQLSYNPILMVSLWEALATRDVHFLQHTMSRQFELSGDCAWINYVRSHDDIGWGFADEDAADLSINGFDHRWFLNRFYIGEFEGSFATGLPFNYNPRTQDMRICGTTASLAGLEQALKQDDPLLIENAIQRILMIYGITLSAGGIPLLYLGDEIGTLNDYSYVNDAAKAMDARWVHRPYSKPNALSDLAYDWHPAGAQIYNTLVRWIAVRTANPALAGGKTRFLETDNPHILAFTRQDQLLVLANFHDFPQIVDLAALTAYWEQHDHVVDLLTDGMIDVHTPLTLKAYQLVWLKPQS